MKLFRVVGLCMAAVLAFTPLAAAEEWLVVGPRALAMGGAGVAVVDDGTAMYWNPAALGSKSLVDVDLFFGASVGAEGGIVAAADDLSDKIDALSGTTGIDAQLDILADGTGLYTPVQKSAAIQEVFSVLDEVGSLDADGQGVYGVAGGGLLVQVKGFGVSVIMMGYGAVDPFVNTNAANWGLIEGSLTSDNQFETMYGVPAGGLTVANGIGGNAVTNTALETTLTTTLTNAGVTAATAALVANEIVSDAETAAGVAAVADPTVAAILDDIAGGTAAATGTGTTTNSMNDAAGAAIKGFQMQEYGVCYSHPILEDRLRGGIRLKVIQGETRFARFSLSDDDADATNNLDDVDGEDMIDELTEDNNTETTSQFDADLGFLFRPHEMVTLGLVARHLVSPEFDYVATADESSVQLSPQLRLGVAVRPIEKIVVALDADVSTNESDILDGYESRQIGLGIEYRPISFLALRAGGFDNVASSETGWVNTAGLGFRFFNFFFDLAGAMSTDTEKIESGTDDEEINQKYAFQGVLGFSSEF